MMAEHGLIDKWAKKHFASDHCSGSHATDANPMSLMDVTGPLMFLLAGVLLAVLALAAELTFAAVTNRPSDVVAQQNRGLIRDLGSDVTDVPHFHPEPPVPTAPRSADEEGSWITSGHKTYRLLISSSSERPPVMMDED